MEYKKKSTEKFIEEAIAIHGDKYDYSLSIYTGSNKKLKIICPEHGEFEMTPNMHISQKCGCRFCFLKRKIKSVSDLIEQAKEIHGDVYDYSLVKYKGIKKHVKIICPVHGIFKQRFDVHFVHGCGKCSALKRSNGTDKFIEQAKAVHRNRNHDYSMVNYVNNHTDVKISCPKHGEFERAPADYLTSKHGCPMCGNENIAAVQSFSVEEFIEKAKEKHGDKYDYSFVEYKNNRSRLRIICPKHGAFLQDAAGHLMGRGCQKCGSSKQTSKPCDKWLKELNVPILEHYMMFVGEKHKRKVDGFDPETNTVFQFHGAFWHSHPDIYDPDKIHPIKKKTFGEVYKETLRKDENIIKSGYNLIVCWEHHYDKRIKSKRK